MTIEDIMDCGVEGWWRRGVVFGDGAGGPNGFYSFLVWFAFSCRQDRMGHDFCRGGGVGPLFWLLVFLRVFVGVVEKFEEVRGFGCSESGHSGVILVWVVFAC